MRNPVERRLVAILAADVAGYSRLTGGADEEGTLRPEIQSLAQFRSVFPWDYNPPHWPLLEKTAVIGLRRVGSQTNKFPRAAEGIRIRRALAARPRRRGAGHDPGTIGLDRLLEKPIDKRLVPLAIALIASRLISPASKLATARELAADTAGSSSTSATSPRSPHPHYKRSAGRKAPGQDPNKF